MSDHPKAAFEKALHKAIAGFLDELADNHGVRVTSLAVTWFDRRPGAELADHAARFRVRSLESMQLSPDPDYGGRPWILRTTQTFPVGEPVGEPTPAGAGATISRTPGA